MRSSSIQNRWKVVLFLVLTAAAALAWHAFASSPRSGIRGNAIAFMSALTLFAGVAWIVEILRQRSMSPDPFGEEMIGSGMFAAGFLKNLDPCREEALLRHLSQSEPEALRSIRPHRVIFSDLQRHSPAAVRFALEACEPEEWHLAGIGLADDFQEFILKMAGSMNETRPDFTPGRETAMAAARSRRKIIEEMEAFYQKMGIHHFDAPLDS